MFNCFLYIPCLFVDCSVTTMRQVSDIDITVFDEDVAGSDVLGKVSFCLGLPICLYGLIFSF